MPPARDGAGTPAGKEGLIAAFALGLATVAALFPILRVDIPPLVDYPAHLARLHILSSLAGTAELREIYEINRAIVPNLAMDVLALPLVKALGIYPAGRVFVALTLLLILGGVLCLNRVLHRRISPWPAFAALFLYNFALFWGFVNYLFSFGLVLFAIAGWFATAHWRPLRRLALFSVVASALFFCHLFAFGIYGLSVAASEIRRLRRPTPNEAPATVGAVALSLGQFAIPVALFVLSMSGQGGGPTAFGAVQDKILALLSPTVFSGGLIDRVAIVFAGVVFIRGLFSRTLAMAPETKAPMLALTAAAVAMPTWLMGTWGADLRLPVALAILLVATTRVDLENKAIHAGLAAVAVVILSVRTATIAEQWRDYDREFAEFRLATTAIEPGSKLLVATRAPAETLKHKPYWHMAAIAVIERSVFLPTLFTDRRRHSVLVKPPYDVLDAVDVTPLPVRMLVETSDPDRARQWRTVRLDRAVNRYWTGWPEHFDYVLILDGEGAANPLPHLMDRVASGAAFDLYRVRSEAAPRH